MVFGKKVVIRIIFAQVEDEIKNHVSSCLQKSNLLLICNFFNKYHETYLKIPKKDTIEHDSGVFAIH